MPCNTVGGIALSLHHLLQAKGDSNRRCKSSTMFSQEGVKMKVQDSDQVSLWVNYKSEDNNYRKVRKTIRRHLYTDFDGFKQGVQTLGCHLQKMCYSKLHGEGEDDDDDGHHD